MKCSFFQTLWRVAITRNDSVAFFTLGRIWTIIHDKCHNPEQSLTETGVESLNVNLTDFHITFTYSWLPNQHWHCAIQSYWKILEYSNENKNTGTFYQNNKFLFRIASFKTSQMQKWLLLIIVLHSQPQWLRTSGYLT